MVIDFEYDDLGERHGNWFDEDGGRARRLACSWEPEAFGNRPVDWARRDLVLGAVQRDRRNWAYRKLVKNRHPAFFHDTIEWSERNRSGIARARSFLFFHYLALLRLSRSDSATSSRTAKEMMDCCPNFFLARQSRQRRVFRPCRHNKACPFCLARAAEETYSSLLTMPSVRSSILVLASITHDVTSLFSHGSTIVPQVRHAFSRRLRNCAESYGANAGMFSIQIGPRCKAKPRLDNFNSESDCMLGYSIRASVLFQVPLDLFCARFVVDDGNIDEENLLDDLSIIGEAPAVRIGAFCSRDPLRSLIFGEPPGNRVSEMRDGYEGLFAYQQWHLANADQWHEFLSATKGTRLFSPWGEWYATRHAPMTKQWTPATERIGAFRKREVLRQANQIRANEADTRASSILEQLWTQFQSYQRSHGRWPGRSEIKRLAGVNAVPISDRQARRVSQMIRQEN